MSWSGDEQADSLLDEVRDYLQTRTSTSPMYGRRVNPEKRSFSHRGKAGIIIMGAYGRNNSELVLGVNLHTINHAPCPVLLIR